MHPSPDHLRDGLSFLERADVAAGLRLGRRRRHPAIRAAGAASELGDQPPLLVLSGSVALYGALARDERALHAGARMLAAVLAATALKTLVKNSFTRSRPNVVLDGGAYEAHRGAAGKGPMQSFPSGHTAGSIAAARALARVYPEVSGPAYGTAAFVAGVQVPRAAHYPGDVLAGLAVGLAAEALIAMIWPVRPASRAGAPSRRSGSRRSPPSPASRAGRASGCGAPDPRGS